MPTSSCPCMRRIAETILCCTRKRVEKCVREWMPHGRWRSTADASDICRYDTSSSASHVVCTDSSMASVYYLGIEQYWSAEDRNHVELVIDVHERPYAYASYLPAGRSSIRHSFCCHVESRGNLWWFGTIRCSRCVSKTTSQLYDECTLPTLTGS